MRRHIPGLHSGQQLPQGNLDGLFLVRVDKASYRWHPQNPFLVLDLVVLDPAAFENRSFAARLYCSRRVLWKLEWFLRDFGYDAELLDRDQVDEKALMGLRGVIRTSHTTVNGRIYQNLDSFAPVEDWPTLTTAIANAEKEVIDGLYLHTDQPILALPAQLSISLSGRLEGKGNSCLNGFRSLF